MTTHTPFPLRSQRSHNNTQANWISENTYTPTSVLYMITHNKVHMYKHVHYICDVQGTMTTSTPFPLRSQRSHSNTHTHTLIQLVQTHIHTHFRPVHGIISVYMVLGCYSVLWAQITTPSWLHPRIRRSHNITGDN